MVAVAAAICTPQLVVFANTATVQKHHGGARPQAGIRTRKSWCAAFPNGPRTLSLQQRHVAIQWLVVEGQFNHRGTPALAYRCGGSWGFAPVWGCAPHSRLTRSHVWLQAPVELVVVALNGVAAGHPKLSRVVVFLVCGNGCAESRAMPSARTHGRAVQLTVGTVTSCN